MAYLLFVGDQYEPSGGAKDLAAPVKFETVDSAIAAYIPGRDAYSEGAHILCLDTLKIVKAINRDGEWSGPE